jgi:DNA-binding protein YbaB
MDISRTEHLERVLRDSEERMRQLSQVETVLAEVSSQFTTDDGLVTVELGADGALRHLGIDPRAMRLDSFTLAERITEAFAGAQQALQEDVARVMSEALGSDNLTDVLDEAHRLRSSMDGMLEDVSRSVNDAIVQASRITGRR